ncbi:MAG: lipoyl(octanoyl) transferase LipB [Dehalococcoidales bacterium]|jgi:lipoyl(octanoyl) transferase|nr:lipoyl(octanoyl) transferase LipB [Dehalococcoidia bacterium]NCG34624.1 lipoyl(octanoyl) transferase LipB [Dehalococcoidales bacterium]
MENKTRNIQALFLGKLDYLKAMLLQEEINFKSQSDPINQKILFLEHDNVITYGSQEKITKEEIHKLNSIDKNFFYVKSNRGGQVTLHNPGQLICYPIIDISKYFSGILEYVTFIEDLIIETLKHYNIHSHRVKKRRGIWVNGDPNEKYDKNLLPKGEKIAALGIKVIKNISMHGFALNIYNDLKVYEKIIPCGMPNLNVSSVQKISSIKYDLEEVAVIISSKFEDILDLKLDFKNIK